MPVVLQHHIPVQRPLVRGQATPLYPCEVHGHVLKHNGLLQPQTRLSGATWAGDAETMSGIFGHLFRSGSQSLYVVTAVSPRPGTEGTLPKPSGAVLLP